MNNHNQNKYIICVVDEGNLCYTKQENDMSAFKNKSIMISIPEFMNTCDLDRNTMYKYLKEGIPYERINHERHCYRFRKG